jgi:hypothetical protein
MGVRVHRVRNDDVIDRLPSVRKQIALRCAAIITLRRHRTGPPFVGRSFPPFR